jgi:ABC-type lipoprotein release transport system permease subunit
LKPVYAALAVAVAPLLAAIASWLPAMLASRQDPAVILREE